MTEAIIEARSLRVGFKVKAGRSFFSAKTKWLWAVDGVDLAIMKGETIGLVGESGCGKTTTAMALLGLENPSGGEILFKGANLNALDAEGMKAYRAAVQAVLQDPWSALSPRSRIGDIVAEPMVVHSRGNRHDHGARVAKLLLDVGLEAEHARRYPHEFSGGQRQRICIARALSVSPELIVLDEPVSALDVSVQAQIINLLKDVQHRTGVSYLLISHSLNTVRFLCSRVAVMYLGQIVELAPTRALFANPLHPYTQGLLAAASPMSADEGHDAVQGEIPSPTELPSGCRFHSRCPKAQDICLKVPPALTRSEDGRQVRCHLY